MNLQLRGLNYILSLHLLKPCRKKGMKLSCKGTSLCPSGLSLYFNKRKPLERQIDRQTDTHTHTQEGGGERKPTFGTWKQPWESVSEII
jgi:GTP cyclohydrolase FolE2